MTTALFLSISRTIIFVGQKIESYCGSWLLIIYGRVCPLPASAIISKAQLFYYFQQICYRTFFHSKLPKTRHPNKHCVTITNIWGGIRHGHIFSVLVDSRYQDISYPVPHRLMRTNLKE